ncbi:MAG: hypothetical protein ACI3W7_00515 [Oscillospiraceae bacterium]
MKKTLALLLAMVMVLALCAGCGSKEEAAPAAEAPAAEAPAAEAPAAPADAGEPSEEPTGEPVAELFPADGYNKDLDGYKAYATDALKQDEHAPAEIVDTTIASIEAATDGNDDAFSMLVNQGLILPYDEFVG